MTGKDKQRAKNNRTTFVTPEECKVLGKNLLKLSDISEGNIFNKTILGTLEEVAKELPNNFVDLLIIDPPYNLNKILAK